MPSENSFEGQYSAFTEGLQSIASLLPPFSTKAIVTSITASNAYEGNLITFTINLSPRMEASWLDFNFSGTANWDTGDFANIYTVLGNTKSFFGVPRGHLANNFGLMIVPANETEITFSIRTTVNNDGSSAVEDATLTTGSVAYRNSATAKIFDLTTAAPDPYKAATITKVIGYNGFEGSVPLIFHVQTGNQNSAFQRSASIRLAGQDVKGGANFIEGSDLGNYADMNDPRYFSSVFSYTNGVRFDPVYKKLIIPAGVTQFDIQLNTINDADKGAELARLWVGDTWGQATLFDGVRGKSDFDGIDSSAPHSPLYQRTEANPVMMA